MLEILKPKVPVHRLVFHEITKDAIQAALASPRSVDEGLVRAQETRRILDRLYGYEVSPLLWRKVRPKLSAGRVQSVAVRMIVERERERMAFVSATWWDLIGQFAKIERPAAASRARLGRWPEDSVRQGFRFRDRQTQEQRADAARRRRRPPRWPSAFAAASSASTNVEDKPYTSKPYPPFTTSTLQQEANRKLGFTARRTMQVAQSLYENGHITYMRTDSTNLAQVAIDDARRLVAEEYGNEFLPAEARVYKSKVKNAQEAHEGIRPAGHPFELPGTLRNTLNADEFKIFDMIWKRTIASQMADARGRRITITIEGEGCVFQVSGKTIDFPGYLRAYVEGSDTPDAELADQEIVLPSVAVGEALKCTRHDGERAHDAGAQPVQRSGADQSARRARHRPAEHVRLDHRHDSESQLRLQEGRRAGADLGCVLGRAVAGRASRRAWSTTSSRRRWKTTSTRSAAASRSTSST